MKEKRMYALVLRQLDGINKGIQVAHACMEYAEKYKDDEDWKQYVNIDKTMIVLNGGVSQDLIDIKDKLDSIGYKYAAFIEPDLGNMITAIVFILDEQIFNKKLYPTFENYFTELCFVKNDAYTKTHIEESKENWIKDIVGGKDNLLLRNIIEPLHFAK